jgi:hypothetical protein
LATSRFRHWGRATTSAIRSSSRWMTDRGATYAYVQAWRREQHDLFRDVGELLSDVIPPASWRELGVAEGRRRIEEAVVIEVREGRRSPYRVRRLEGKLSASFRVRAARRALASLGRPDSGSRRSGTEDPARARSAATQPRPTGTLDHAPRRTLGGAPEEERDPRAGEGGRAAPRRIHRRFLSEVGRGKVVLRGVVRKERSAK